MTKLNYFNKPKSIEIDVDAYLKRINCQKESVGVDYLRRLHYQHLLHIPFENLDIHYKNNIILDYKKIFQKVVLQKRGGFCYELNGLFYHLLFHLGFHCHILSAEVYHPKKKAFGKDFDHMLLLVVLDHSEWIVDVGFGTAFHYPKELIINEPQLDFTTYWLLEEEDKSIILKKSNDNNIFIPVYRFQLIERQPIEFIQMCDYHQSSPESSFTQKKVITRPTEKGKITLTDKELIIGALGVESTTPILNEDEFLVKLREHFHIGIRQLDNL